MTEETKCVSHRWFCLWNILPPTGIFCHCQTQYLARPPTPSLLPPFWFRLQSKANRQFVYLQQIFSHLGHSRREQGTLACPLCPQHISRANSFCLLQTFAMDSCVMAEFHMSLGRLVAWQECLTFLGEIVSSNSCWGYIPHVSTKPGMELLSPPDQIGAVVRLWNLHPL